MFSPYSPSIYGMVRGLAFVGRRGNPEKRDSLRPAPKGFRAKLAMTDENVMLSKSYRTAVYRCFQFGAG